jgi:hypothetical protein
VQDNDALGELVRPFTRDAELAALVGDLQAVLWDAREVDGERVAAVRLGDLIVGAPGRKGLGLCG